MSEDNEQLKKMIADKVREHGDRGDKNFLSIKIAGRNETLPVISIGTKCLILNHNNHRLTGQIQDLTDIEELERDPTSQSAQTLIRDLLQSTEKFPNLVDDLKNYGQRDPGLITGDGLLINGNTRAVALLKLGSEGLDGAQSINVAVLPGTVTEDDIIEIEMSLQMTLLTHQDYSFTNQLLFMKTYLDRGKSPKELGHKLNWQRRVSQKVEMHMRVLGMIEELRRKANTPPSYTYFDSKKTHLLDLDNDYQSRMGNGDAKGADQLKWQRLLGMLLNINKDHVRAIGDEFLEDIYEARAEEGSSVKQLLNKFKTVELIDDNLGGILDLEPELDPDGELLPSISAEKMVEELLCQDNILDNTGIIKTDLGDDNPFSDLVKIMDDETNRLIAEGRQETKQQELHTTIQGIRQDISRVKEKVPERTGEPGFQSGSFKYELDELKKELEDLVEVFESLSQ